MVKHYMQARKLERDARNVGFEIGTKLGNFVHLFIFFILFTYKHLDVFFFFLLFMGWFVQHGKNVKGGMF